LLLEPLPLMLPTRLPVLLLLLLLLPAPPRRQSVRRIASASGVSSVLSSVNWGGRQAGKGASE